MQLHVPHQDPVVERACQTQRLQAPLRGRRSQRLSVRAEGGTSHLLPALRRRPFSHGHLEVLAGDFVSIAIACLDDVEPSELAELPVGYADGRNNAWWNQPHGNPPPLRESEAWPSSGPARSLDRGAVIFRSIRALRIANVWPSQPLIPDHREMRFAHSSSRSAGSSLASIASSSLFGGSLSDPTVSD